MRDCCTIALAAWLGVAAAACDPRDFNDYESQAQIRVVARPSNYRRAEFGAVLTTYRRTDDDTELGRIVISAGAGSPIAFASAWDGERPQSSVSTRCKDEDDCAGVGVGSALAAFDVWGAGLSFEEHGCVLTPGDPDMFVFCETSPTLQQRISARWPVTAAGDEELRFSAVGLPRESPLGVALIGLYSFKLRGGVPRAGHVVIQPDIPDESGNVPGLRELALIDPETGAPFHAASAPNDFGYAVAADTMSTGELLLAISQPSHERVVLASHAGGAGDPVVLRGCIRSPNPALVGFGRVLALGDINGDGAPEVFAGIDPLAEDNGALSERLYVYDGQGLPAHDPGATTCPDWQGAQALVDCKEGRRGVGCRGTAFGASLAVGDVDDDGLDDLIVGAPRADLQGLVEAGVVWVFPGGSDRAQGAHGLRTDQGAVLFANGLHDDAHVGWSVGALHTGETRVEPVAGAPGEDKVYTFFCSPLAGDDDYENLCI